jgi:hypothetical protein
MLLKMLTKSFGDNTSKIDWDGVADLTPKFGEIHTIPLSEKPVILWKSL